MARRTTLVSRFLLLAGAVMLLVGAVAVAVAVVDPEAVKARLPEVVIDAAAVGGALAGLGVVAGALGLAHLVVAIGLRVGARWSPTASVVLCAMLAVLALAAAIAAGVSAGRSPAFVVTGIGLALLGAAYASSVVAVIRLMRAEQGASGS